MHLIPRSRLASVIVGTVLLTIRPGALRPCRQISRRLTPPASTEHVTGQTRLGRPFHQQSREERPPSVIRPLLGWTATSLDQQGKGYTVFSNNGHLRRGAGAPQRHRNQPSRAVDWLLRRQRHRRHIGAGHHINGGLIRAKAHKFPDRGSQAIVADNDGTPGRAPPNRVRGTPSITNRGPGRLELVRTLLQESEGNRNVLSQYSRLRRRPGNQLGPQERLRTLERRACQGRRRTAARGQQ